MLQRPSPLSPISENTMPRTNGAIPIDIVQHAPGVIHASVVESVAAIPPLGSFMLSRCPMMPRTTTGQKCGKPTVLIIRSAHLRACMPPQPSCLPFPLPLGSPRQPSQKQRSNASLIGPSGIRPSKNARVLWGGKRFTDKRQAPRNGCRVRRGEISRIVREPRTVTLFRSAHFRN